MKLTKALLLLSVTPTWIACGNQPSNSAKVSSAGVIFTSAADTQNSLDLVGSWERCEAVGDEFSDVLGVPSPSKGMRVKLSFAADGQGHLETSYTTDTTCRVDVTEQDLEAYYQTLLNKCLEMAAEVVCKDLKLPSAEPTRLDLAFKYRATAPNLQGVGELDLTVAADDSAQYLSYRFAENGLQITESCGADDVQNGVCSVVSGSSAASRAGDFAHAKVYNRFY